MPVKVRCRGCQKVLNAPDKARGRVIACPDCGTKIKIPTGDGPAAATGGSPAAKPAKPVKKAARKSVGADSEDFLSGLNVDQLEAEHGEEKVCPYCAADLDPEDPVCRKCGMNTATGQMDVKEAKKRARKGPDPALFYGAAWTDSWEFLQRYWRLGIKTGLAWTGFLTVVLTCLFLMKAWVFVEATEPVAAAHGPPGEEAPGPTSPWLSPGFFFYAGVGMVFFLGIPGWFWSLSLKIIDATMQKEDLKEDRINVDVFESLALGFRLIFWPSILMLPVGPIYSFLAFTLGAVAFIQGSATTLGVGLILLMVSYFALPYLFFPQALVHMTARHRFKAWILWDQLVCFVKNAPATLYWWLVAITVFLPIIVMLVLIGMNPASAFNGAYEKLDGLAAWMFGFMMDVGQPESRGLFYTVLFSLFLPMILALISAPIAFLAAFPAVFLMRATGLYGVYRRETLGLVTHVSVNQPAGFWVRFLCRAIDVSFVTGFWLLMFGIPFWLVASEFPLGRYFGGAIMAAINVGFIAIAASKSAKASMLGIGLGVLAGVTFIYGATIEVFQMVFGLLFYFIYAFNMGLNFVVNEASTSRSTIGKEAFGLIVQTVDKQKELTFGQAMGRHLGRILCDGLGGLPYITCAFNPKKQALHDIMAKTEVVFRGDK